MYPDKETPSASILSKCGERCKLILLVLFILLMFVAALQIGLKVIDAQADGAVYARAMEPHAHKRALCLAESGLR